MLTFVYAGAGNGECSTHLTAVAQIVSHFPEPGGWNIKLKKWFLDSIKNNGY